MIRPCFIQHRMSSLILNKKILFFRNEIYKSKFRRPFDEADRGVLSLLNSDKLRTFETLTCIKLLENPEEPIDQVEYSLELVTLFKRRIQYLLKGYHSDPRCKINIEVTVLSVVNKLRQFDKELSKYLNIFKQLKSDHIYENISFHENTNKVVELVS